MRAIIREIKTINGNLVPVKYVIKNGNKCYLKTVCTNSEALGLGQCQCNSHNVWNKREISKETALDIVNEAFNNGIIR